MSDIQRILQGMPPTARPPAGSPQPPAATAAAYGAPQAAPAPVGAPYAPHPHPHHQPPPAYGAPPPAGAAGYQYPPAGAPGGQPLPPPGAGVITPPPPACVIYTGVTQPGGFPLADKIKGPGKWDCGGAKLNTVGFVRKLGAGYGAAQLIPTGPTPSLCTQGTPTYSTSRPLQAPRCSCGAAAPLMLRGGWGSTGERA